MDKATKIILIISFAVLGTGILAVPSTFAQPAPDNLIAEFQATPLFNEAKIMPGDGVTRWIKVTNNSGATQKIATEGVNESDPDGLGDKLNLEIKEGGNPLYTGTLTQFFAAGEVLLSDLGNGVQTQYDFTISFDFAAENYFQGKRLSFDINIGFPGELLPPPQPPLSTIVGGGSGGGGGGGGVPITLQIFNVRTAETTGDGTTVTWQTNLFSTSQLIYSAEWEGHTFNLSLPPYYGYAHIYPVPEDSTMKTFHTILLPGLQPCTTYYYRVISHEGSLSSLTVSPESSFTTLCSFNEEGGPLTPPPFPPAVAGTTTEAASGTEGTTGEEPGEGTIEENEIPLVAGLSDSVGNIFRDFGGILASCLPWWLILLFMILPLIKGINAFKKAEKEANLVLRKYFKKQGNIWFASLSIPIILIFLIHCLHLFCFFFWLFFLLVLISLAGWYFDAKITKRKLRNSF